MGEDAAQSFEPLRKKGWQKGRSPISSVSSLQATKALVHKDGYGQMYSSSFNRPAPNPGAAPRAKPLAVKQNKNSDRNQEGGHSMTKRLWSLLLCLCFTALLLPNVSFAASGNVYTFYDNQDASYQNGSVVWKSSERTLYLSNATIATEQNGINFSCNGDVTIVLQGTNSITVNNNTTSGVVYALNTRSEKLTLKGTETDGYMGTLTLETKKSKGDNAVIYDFDHLTVENVAHLNVIAGNCSSSKSSYGLWSLGQHQTLQFTNTCVEISVKEAGNYGYAIYNYGDNYADREMDIKFNNSSLKIISKSGRVVRDKKWDGAVYVNDINVGNPQTGTDGYTSTSSGKIVYHLHR